MRDVDGPQEDLRSQLAAQHRAAYGWALACCDRDPHEAQDVLQASYLKVLDGDARFDGRASFRTWLFSVIRLTAADARRRRLLRHLLLQRSAALDTGECTAAGADMDVAQRQQREQFLDALRRLPRRQREALLLVFYHDMSVEEAARVMAVSAGSARQHYERGKAKLRALLARGAVLT